MRKFGEHEIILIMLCREDFLQKVQFFHFFSQASLGQDESATVDGAERE